MSHARAECSCSERCSSLDLSWCWCLLAPCTGVHFTAPGMSDVPSLAQLCGDFITQTAIIDLRNAPEMLEFAMQHDVQALCQRAQQFITTCWSAMQDIHSPDALRACLGDELYAKLAEEQAETERGVRRLSLVGEVLEKPAASSEPVTPLRTASGRQTYPY